MNYCLTFCLSVNECADEMTDVKDVKDVKDIKEMNVKRDECKNKSERQGESEKIYRYSHFSLL